MTGGGSGTRGLAADVQRSLRRSRLEAERRRLERERRGALARLGERICELVAAGALPSVDLAGELEVVEGWWRRLEEKGREIEGLGAPLREAAPAAAPAPDSAEPARGRR